MAFDFDNSEYMNAIGRGAPKSQPNEDTSKDESGMFSGISTSIGNAVDKVTSFVGSGLLRVLFVIVGIGMLAFGAYSFLPRKK
jgi:hypothetical protein